MSGGGVGADRPLRPHCCGWWRRYGEDLGVTAIGDSVCSVDVLLWDGPKVVWLASRP